MRDLDTAPGPIPATGDAPQLTMFRVANGRPLSKIIRLDPETGKPRSTARDEVMPDTASRLDVADIHALAKVLDHFPTNGALCLGRIRPAASSSVFKVTTAAAYAKRANHPPALITRTKDFLEFTADPGFGLIDHDRDGMPDEVAERLVQRGGFMAWLQDTLPGVAMLHRASTSTGLSLNGTSFSGSGGIHAYLQLADVSDYPALLKWLDQRAWADGLGSIKLNKPGIAKLRRSIVDASTASPERLVFEADAEIVPPLVQDMAARRCVVLPGEPWHRPLDFVEPEEHRKVAAAADRKFKPKLEEGRNKYRERMLALLVEDGFSPAEARKMGQKAQARKSAR